jgi:hypothetical protein
MLRPPHLVLRWLRLAMACLALAVGGTPAQARPGPEAPVAVLVDRSAPAESRPGAERSVHVAPLHIKEGPARAVAPLASAGRGAEPGPPRRLFLLHRALLR